MREMGKRKSFLSSKLKEGEAKEADNNRSRFSGSQQGGNEQPSPRIETLFVGNWQLGDGHKSNKEGPLFLLIQSSSS